MVKKKIKNFISCPPSLPPLFFTEIWERFSYYGMRSILLLYIYYSTTSGGLGLPQITAASIVSIYGSLIHISSLGGGYLGDRILNPYKTVLIGSFLIMIGHIILAIPGGFYALLISLALIIVGTGFLKPNVATMVGLSYTDGDNKRDVGYLLFVMVINIGAFVAPLIVGYFGETYSFHLGFSLAAIGMFFGLLIYIFSKKRMNKEFFKTSNPLNVKEKKKLMKIVLIVIVFIMIAIFILNIYDLLIVENMISLIAIIIVIVPILFFSKLLKSNNYGKIEKNKIKGLIPLFLGGVLMFMIHGQISTTLTIFSKEHISLGWIPVSWIQSIDPMFYLILLPVFAYILSKFKSNPPSAPFKFSIGLFFAGSSFLILSVALIIYGTNVLINPIWLLFSLFILTIGYSLIYPTGLSITSKLSPKDSKSQMMGIWLISESVASALVSQIVKLYSSNELSYFALTGLVVIIGGVILFLVRKPITKLMMNVT
ncbi:MAG: oligopeptide:H+ symporter [Methanobrevibacter sp.]|jgi:POT family proton-dependent oligopeptide transporter|nr:oligopeptide:H+ symporter [Candidatus Methanoflexus mossambicus]